MAEQKTPADPNIPLPDPDRVQRTFEDALRRFQERPTYYTAVAVIAVLLAIGVIFVFSFGSAPEESAFAPLWRRCTAVREKLAADAAADAELTELRTYVEQIRGAQEEGVGLWLLAIYEYRAAWTSDKSSFLERKPHFDKALACLDELRSERFDARDLLLDKGRWFTASTKSPIDELHAQVTKDLDWARDNSYVEPKTSDRIVAVLRTNAGDIHLQFFAELAPRLTDNFLTLAAAGTYNETYLHFAWRGNQEPKGIQGGDPYTFFYNDPLEQKQILRWGRGGVGYEVPPEEARFRIDHRAGVVTSMMRDKADWNNGSQFMIMVDHDPDLDRRHTPFAKVVEGLSVAEKAAKRKTASQHPPFKDEYAFSSVATRDLIVDPVIVHKVIVYEAGKARAHAFPLTQAEQSLATLAQEPGAPITDEDALYAGRLLRAVDADGDPRPGLDIPFPEDVDAAKDDPKGKRKK